MDNQRNVSTNISKGTLYSTQDHENISHSYGNTFQAPTGFSPKHLKETASKRARLFIRGRVGATKWTGVGMSSLSLQKGGGWKRF